MDVRDRQHWIREARKKYALDQRRACEASLYPNMSEEFQETYMNNLNEQIKASDFDAEKAQEKEWAKNIDELAAKFGRKK